MRAIIKLTEKAKEIDLEIKYEFDPYITIDDFTKKPYQTLRFTTDEGYIEIDNRRLCIYTDYELIDEFIVAKIIELANAGLITYEFRKD